MSPDRRRHRDRRIPCRRDGQVGCACLLPLLFMTHHTILRLKETRSPIAVSFLIEVTLRKKIGHQVVHVARAKNWKVSSSSGVHYRSMVPHGSNIASQTVGSWSLE